MSPSLVVAEKTPVAAPVSPSLRGYPKWLLCVPEIGFLDGSLRPAIQYCWLVTGKLLAWTVECFALRLSFLSSCFGWPTAFPTHLCGSMWLDPCLGWNIRHILNSFSFLVVWRSGCFPFWLKQASKLRCGRVRTACNMHSEMNITLW